MDSVGRLNFVPMRQHARVLTLIGSCPVWLQEGEKAQFVPINLKVRVLILIGSPSSLAGEGGGKA